MSTFPSLLHTDFSIATLNMEILSSKKGRAKHENEKKNKKTKSMWETKQKIYGVPQGSSGKTLMATDLPQNCFNTSTDTAELVTQIIGQIIFFCEVIEFSNLVLIVCFFFSRTESLYWQHCKCDGRCNLSSITYFDRLQV